MGAIQPTHIAAIVIVALLLFAAPKLPQIARNLGESMRVFRSEVRQMKDENGDEKDKRDGSHSEDGTVTGRVVDGDRK